MHFRKVRDENNAKIKVYGKNFFVNLRDFKKWNEHLQKNKNKFRRNILGPLRKNEVLLKDTENLKKKTKYLWPRKG